MKTMVETVETVDRPASGGPRWNPKPSVAIPQAEQSTNSPKRSDQPSIGFTLIELLITISIIGILFSFGVVKYGQFNRRQALIQAAQELKSNLHLAQGKALAGEKPAGCGATPLSGHKLKFVDSRNYKIVAACGAEVDVKTGLTLGPNITKVSGPSSILFKVLAQGVEGAGTITLRFAGVGDETVTVTETGEIR